MLSFIYRLFTNVFSFIYRLFTNVFSFIYRLFTNVFSFIYRLFTNVFSFFEASLHLRLNTLCFYKNQEIWPEPQYSYFSYKSQPQNVLILFLFYHLFFLPILILLVSWCDSIHTFDYVFECMIFFQENTIISNKAFNTIVFKSIIRVKCLSSQKMF